MATSPSLVSVQDYVRDFVDRETKPMCEYVDGVLVPKGMGTPAHARTQARLAALLQGLGFEVFVELHGRLREAEFRVPDVVLMRPGTTSGDYPGPDNPPYLCIEVLSPDQGSEQMLAKCERFHAWGVPFCWVIDPEKKVAWVYHKGQEPRKIRSLDENLDAGEITFLPADLFV
jgi:Uma2 family endonuclease